MKQGKRDRRAYLREYRLLRAVEINARRRAHYRTDKKYRINIKKSRSIYYRKNKAKILKQKREYGQREEVKKKKKSYLADYRKKNCKKLAELSKQYQHLHKEKLRSYYREYRFKNKVAALAKYGGKCAYCGIDELAVLSIDHINDDSSQDASSRCYAVIQKLLPRNDLQVLCMNCQFRKRAYGKDFSTWESKKEYLE